MKGERRRVESFVQKGKWREYKLECGHIAKRRESKEKPSLDYAYCLECGDIEAICTITIIYQGGKKETLKLEKVAEVKVHWREPRLVKNETNNAGRVADD